jgi:anti-sigma-K factor RskA
MTEAHNGGHEHWEGDAAAYALRALPEDHVQAFEEHLAACRRCQDELASFREAVVALSSAAPPLAPSPELKQRVLATVGAEAAPRASSEAAAEPNRPARRPPWLGTRASWLTPGVAIAAVAAAALLVMLGVLTLGNGSSVRTFPGVVHAPGATASVRESGESAQLQFSRMPPPPAGRIYQVWLKRAGAPQPTRTLFAARSGSVAVNGNLRGVQAVLVTDEPRPNGSLAPTRAPIIVVRLG